MKASFPSTIPTTRTGRPLAKWLDPGKVLMVRDRTINLQECQVVLHPTRLSIIPDEDAIVSTQFWFRRPVVDGTLYRFDLSTQMLQPVQPNEDIRAIAPQHLLWLIQFTGKPALAVRRLLSQFQVDKSIF